MSKDKYKETKITIKLLDSTLEILDLICEAKGISRDECIEKMIQDNAPDEDL